MYEENEAKKRYRRNLEIENESKQIQGCTFKPQTFSQTQSFINTSFGSTTPKSSKGEVFNRLYSESSNLKRKKIKQEIDKRQEEDTKYSFHPERVTKFKDKDFGLEDDETSSPNRVYEKLYKDAENHNSRLNLRQRAAQRELQEMSRFSCLSYRTSGEQNLTNNLLENWDPNNLNRYDKLYNDREKSATRQKEVFQKVMKEEG